MSRDFELLQRLERDNVSHRQWPASRVLPEVVQDTPERVVRISPPDGPRPGSVRDWHQLLAVIMRNWKLSFLFGGAILLTVVAVTYLQKPLYAPEAKIEIEPPGQEVFSLHGEGLGSGDPEYVETQVQALGSDDLALEVIRDLHLDKNREFVDPKDLNETPSASTKPPAAPNVVQPTDAENDVLAVFAKRLVVKRDSNGRLVRVSFGSHDPVVAAQITNALIDHFINKNFRIRNEAIKHSSEWLAKQLDDIRSKMEKSNADLSEFQRTSGITDVDEKQSTVEQNVQGLNQQYTQAQVDRIQFESYLNAVRSGSADSLPQIRDNPTIQVLTQKLSEVKGELAQALTTYGKNNANAKKYQQEVDALEADLARQRQGVYSSIETSYEAAKNREGMLSRQMKGTTKDTSLVAEYKDLKKQAQTNTDLYNTLYARVKEADISAASKSSNITVVDQARVLDEPTHPRKTLNLAMGFLAALIGGILIAFVKEGMDTTIRSSEEVKQWTGIQGIAMMPAIADGNEEKHRSLKQLFRPQNGFEYQSAAKLLLRDPVSPQAEAIRNLHASIVLGHQETRRMFLICSAMPAEGKTTLAVNLAVSLARHSETCLVDADLRRPSIAKAFGISHKKGLSDLLTSGVPLSETLIQVPEMPHLSLLPTDPLSPEALQFSDTLPVRELFQELRARFKYIVIDSSPLVPFADSRSLTPLVDGLILAGRYGVTDRGALARCVELLGELHSAPILQFVMNGADIKSSEYASYI